MLRYLLGVVAGATITSMVWVMVPQFKRPITSYISGDLASVHFCDDKPTKIFVYSGRVTVQCDKEVEHVIRVDRLANTIHARGLVLISPNEAGFLIERRRNGNDTVHNANATER